jgi:hypothetical protein
MAYNPFYNFTEAGASPPPRNDAIRHRKYNAAEYAHALDDLMDNMYEISDDPSGSKPEDYMSRDDAEVCRRVAGLADDIGWVNANEFGRMKTSREPPEILPDWLRSRLQIPAWKTRRHIARTALMTAVAFKETGEGHRGYILGVLGASPDQLVALCDDGRLRSLRADELDRSKAFGWGRLPDPDKLNAALGIGKVQGVEYMNVTSNPKSKTLAGKLLENVPGELLTEDLLARHGLTDYKRLHSSELVGGEHRAPVAA